MTSSPIAFLLGLENLRMDCFTGRAPGSMFRACFGEFSGNAWYVCWTPCKYAPAFPEELDERAFLFVGENGRNDCCLRAIRQMDLYSFGFTSRVEGVFG